MNFCVLPHLIWRLSVTGTPLCVSQPLASTTLRREVQKCANIPVIRAMMGCQLFALLMEDRPKFPLTTIQIWNDSVASSFAGDALPSSPTWTAGGKDHGNHSSHQGWQGIPTSPFHAKKHGKCLLLGPLLQYTSSVTHRQKQRRGHRYKLRLRNMPSSVSQRRKSAVGVPPHDGKRRTAAASSLPNAAIPPIWTANSRTIWNATLPNFVFRDLKNSAPVLIAVDYLHP